MRVYSKWAKKKIPIKEMNGTWSDSQKLCSKLKEHEKSSIVEVT